MQYTQQQLEEVTWNYGMDPNNPADVTAVREWSQHTYVETFIAHAIIMPGVQGLWGGYLRLCIHA